MESTSASALYAAASAISIIELNYFKVLDKREESSAGAAAAVPF